VTSRTRHLGIRDASSFAWEWNMGECVTMYSFHQYSISDTL